jgi:hypothetical protein
MNEIEFIYISKYFYEVCERPKPAKEFLPEWFKSMPPYEKTLDNPDGSKLILSEDGYSNASGKKCIPMFDAMTSGYIVPLWADVQVSQENNFPKIKWRVKENVFELHGPSSRNIPPPFGYDSVVFKYLSQFKIKTPPGYSVLVIPVSGHYRLPFTAIPAIIDTEKSSGDAAFPLWIQSGFNGIIKKGTPLVQIIPFKKENWKSKFSWITLEQYYIELDKSFNSNILNNYLKNIWNKKTYK